MQLKREHPSWGAPKIREKLRRRSRDILLPAISTVHAVLDRHGLVTRGRRRSATRPRAPGCPSRPGPTICGASITRASSCSAIAATAIRSPSATSPAAICLCCDALETTREIYAFSVFERAFKDYGLPSAIRTDNGIPFASRTAFFGLSKLSVWWLRLGITLERIQPGQPQQNGRHERMHLTLKKEATKPPGKNFLQQQAKFDHFIQEYNQERPHQALGMHYPGRALHASPRPYRGLPQLEYPLHDHTITVTHCGRICLGGRKINLSVVFAGQNVGVREVADHVWLVSFMHYDLGFFDDQTCRVECAPNPFGAKVLPMSPE